MNELTAEEWRIRVQQLEKELREWERGDVGKANRYMADCTITAEKKARLATVRAETAEAELKRLRAEKFFSEGPPLDPCASCGRVMLAGQCCTGPHTWQERAAQAESERDGLRLEIHGSSPNSSDPNVIGLRALLEAAYGQRDDATALAAQLRGALNAQKAWDLMDAQTTPAARAADDALDAQMHRDRLVLRRLQREALAATVETADWISPDEYQRGLEDAHSRATEQERDGWMQGLKSCGIHVQAASDTSIKQAIEAYNARSKDPEESVNVLARGPKGYTREQHAEAIARHKEKP